MAADITALQTVDAATAEGITALQAVDAATAEGITALQAADAATADSITALQTADAAMADSITALQTADAAMAQDITALQAVDAATAEDIDTLKAADETAAGEREEVNEWINEYERRNTIKVSVNDVITFGHYPQTAGTGKNNAAIKWIVLEVDGDRALLLSQRILDAKPYDVTGKSYNWASSSLRKWLNSTFIKTAFTSKQQKAIEKTALTNGESTGAKGYLTGNDADTTDQVFILSYAEVRKYLGGASSSICTGTVYARRQGLVTDGNTHGRWWLRNPGRGANAAASIYSNGILRSEVVSYAKIGVRPAMWVNINSEYFAN